MRAEGLRGIPRKKTCTTTVSHGAETERPEDLVKGWLRTITAHSWESLLHRSLGVPRPHQSWVAAR
jgi:hypothetical protein